MNLKNLIGGYVPQDINERIAESIKTKPFQQFATVMIQETDGIIKGIGQSKRNNLILDNFGIWLAGLIRAPVSANKQSAEYLDTAGVADKWFMYQNGAGTDEFNKGAGAGFNMQIGSGVTPATRGDYVIETPFIVAPEDDVFPSGNGAYAVGVVSCVGVIVAGGAGTINETVLYAYFNDDANNLENVAFFHDILATGEAFVLGETITVTYTINL